MYPAAMKQMGGCPHSICPPQGATEPATCGTHQHLLTGARALLVSWNTAGLQVYIVSKAIYIKRE